MYEDVPQLKKPAFVLPSKHTNRSANNAASLSFLLIRISTMGFADDHLDFFGENIPRLDSIADCFKYQRKILFPKVPSFKFTCDDL